jgi:hypothetical protein
MRKMMSCLHRFFGGSVIDQLDRSIARLKELRDSYRALNVEIYGEEIAKLLNDW